MLEQQFRVGVDLTPEDDMARLYIWTGYGDRKRLVVLVGNDENAPGHPVWQEVDVRAGARAPRASLILPRDLLDAIVRGSSPHPAENDLLRQHRDDAVKVRDMALNLIDHVVRRP